MPVYGTSCPRSFNLKGVRESFAEWHGLTITVKQIQGGLGEWSTCKPSRSGKRSKGLRTIGQRGRSVKKLVEIFQS